MTGQLWILLGLVMVSVPAMAKCSSLQFNKPEVCISYYKQQFLTTNGINQIQADSFMKNPVNDCRLMSETLYEESCNFYKMSKQCIEACSKGDTKAAEGDLFPFKIVCSDMHEEYTKFFDNCETLPFCDCTQCDNPLYKKYEESFVLLISFADHIQRSHIKEACQFLNFTVNRKPESFETQCEEDAFKLQTNTMKKMVLSVVDQILEADEGLKPMPLACKDLSHPFGYATVRPETTTVRPEVTSTTDGSGTARPKPFCTLFFLIIFGILKQIGAF